jgi:SAM-dependent methyltransferase
MDSLKQQTINTYNNSAQELAEYFSGVSGPRKKFIDQIFSYCSKNNPKILEIGCGDGREAEYILNKTNNYRGFDISKGMINLAKKRKLEADFFIADMEKDNFAEEYDIVFSLSSLLHSNRRVIKKIINKIANNLTEKGILAIDLKIEDKYRQEVKNDKFGKRVFYYYPQKLIEKFVSKKYKILSTETEKIGHSNWLMIILQTK